MSRYKKLYDFMLENGELQLIFPDLIGDWEKDKNQFIYEQKQMEDLTGDYDTKF